MKLIVVYLLFAGTLVDVLHGKAVTGVLFSRLFTKIGNPMYNLHIADTPEAPNIASTTNRPVEVPDSASTTTDDDDDTAEPIDTTPPAPQQVLPLPAAATTTLSTPSSTAPPSSIENMSTCIRCICLSLSQCDASVCDPNKELCDLWHITYMVWRASGSPMVPGEEYPNPISAFENCRSNDTCAARSITQYFELNKAVRAHYIIVRG